MRVSCHPTVHEWLIYVVNHPGPWLVGEATRRLGPVVRVPVLGTLVNDPDVAAALMHQDATFTKAGPGSIGALVTQVMGPSSLINMDGAAHHALRDKLRDLFAPAYVETLARDGLNAPLTELTRRLVAGQTVDLVAFMRQLSSRVTCLMLGVGVPDQPSAAAAAYSAIYALGEQLAALVRFSARPMSSQQVAAARIPFERLIDHTRAAYEQGYAPPGSIIGRLRDLDLDFDEVKGVLGAILVAGTQTVSVALPRIVALLLDTGAWSHLQNRPERVPAAVDEGLRCCVPIPATIRSVATDSVVGGHRFAAGSRAFIFTYNLAKNPALFPHPERFDITRPDQPRARHLWYGSGPHFCLGFALAQHELRAVVETLLRAPGRLRIVRRRYARGVLLPGYAQLEVRSDAPG